MRETKFIDQNHEKWAEFETMLRDNHRDPDKLNDLFIQITDDLSYARTFYPNRSVRMYLNSLAQRIFHNIYRGKRFPAGRFRRFWTDELPQLMWESRRALLLSFSLFVLACGVGVVSSRINPDFARVILGDDYVNMTLENIQNNDPMAVYKESRPLGMSVGIAANNLFVALRTAIFGVLGAIGTAFMLLYNGVMVGAFQYFFVEKGVFWQSFLTIWIHGTLEISAIIIAGAAGLVAGSGLLFPGTYTRSQAFQLSMRRGLKIFIGLIPMFVLAAFFEGFLTRYTDTPAALRLAFILCSLAFVLWYFVWLPWHKARRSDTAATIPEKELPPTRTQPVDFTAIKSGGEVFSDACTLLRRHPRIVWPGLLGAALFSIGLSTAVVYPSVGEAYVFQDFPTGTLLGWREAMHRLERPLLMAGQVLVFCLVAWAAMAAVRREMPPERRAVQPSVWGWHQLVAALASFLLLWFLNTVEAGTFFWLAGIALFPFTGFWVAVAYQEGSSWQALSRALRLMRWGQGFTLGFLIVNFAFLFFLFFDSEIWGMLLRFFSWLIPPDEGLMHFYSMYTTALFANLTALLTWMMFLLTGALQYFSAREINDAASLAEGIQQVGSTRQIRGLARE